MRALVPVLLLVAACSGTPERQDQPEPRPVPERIKKQEQGLAVSRDTAGFTDDRPVPKPSRAEIAEFNRIWEHFRRNDPRWPLERDRLKRKSEAAGYMLAGSLLRYYLRVNTARDRAVKELMRVKDEIVAVGQPCALYLVELMILDRIEFRGGTFITDDLTRQDCLDMLERMGRQATPDLLKALARKQLGVKGRRHLTLALGGTKDRRAYEPLVRLLIEDRSWQVRADAASALGKLGDRRAVGPLGRAVRTDPDPAVVRRAGKARYMLRGGR